MQIREVMTSDYKVVKPDCTIKEAASFMLSEDTGSLPVCDGETVLGMITDRDIAVRFIARCHAGIVRVQHQNAMSNIRMAAKRVERPGHQRSALQASPLLRQTAAGPRSATCCNDDRCCVHVTLDFPVTV